MPTTIAVITGLTYGGVDLQDLSAGHLRIYFELASGGPDWAPEVRGDDRTIPYRDGQIYSPKRPHRLPILLSGFVSGEGATEALQRADTATARQEMYTLFLPWGGVKTLTCTTEDGTSWSISAYPESGPIWDLEPIVPTKWGCSTRLIAIDPPYWTAAGS